MNDRQPSMDHDPVLNDPNQLTLDVLACHLTLLIGFARRHVDIEDLIDRMFWDLGTLSCTSLAARNALTVLTGTCGGDGDTMDPERVARRLRTLRGRIG
jgi:hypothetical protein